MAAELAERILNTVTTTIQICGQHSQSTYSLLCAPSNCVVRRWTLDANVIAYGFAYKSTLKDGTDAVMIVTWEDGFTNCCEYVLPYCGICTFAVVKNV